MKPTVKLASATTPDGELMTLNEHDGEFTIDLDRDTLMSSRQNESELELARLGCARIVDRRSRSMAGGAVAGCGWEIQLIPGAVVRCIGIRP